MCAMRHKNILPLGDGTSSPGNDEPPQYSSKVFEAAVVVVCLLLAAGIIIWAIAQNLSRKGA